jgi:hypothetical protein
MNSPRSAWTTHSRNSFGVAKFTLETSAAKDWHAAVRTTHATTSAAVGEMVTNSLSDLGRPRGDYSFTLLALAIAWAHNLIAVGPATSYVLSFSHFQFLSLVG